MTSPFVQRTRLTQAHSGSSLKSSSRESARTTGVSGGHGGHLVQILPPVPSSSATHVSVACIPALTGRWGGLSHVPPVPILHGQVSAGERWDGWGGAQPWRRVHIRVTARGRMRRLSGRWRRESQPRWVTGRGDNGRSTRDVVAEGGLTHLGGSSRDGAQAAALVRFAVGGHILVRGLGHQTVRLGGPQGWGGWGITRPSCAILTGGGGSPGRGNIVVLRHGPTHGGHGVWTVTETRAGGAGTVTWHGKWDSRVQVHVVGRHWTPCHPEHRSLSPAAGRDFVIIIIQTGLGSPKLAGPWLIVQFLTAWPRPVISLLVPSIGRVAVHIKHTVMKTVLGMLTVVNVRAFLFWRRGRCLVLWRTVRTVRASIPIATPFWRASRALIEKDVGLRRSGRGRLGVAGRRGRGDGVGPRGRSLQGLRGDGWRGGHCGPRGAVAHYRGAAWCHTARQAMNTQPGIWDVCSWKKWDNGDKRIIYVFWLATLSRASGTSVAERNESIMTNLFISYMELDFDWPQEGSQQMRSAAFSLETMGYWRQASP